MVYTYMYMCVLVHLLLLLYYYCIDCSRVQSNVRVIISVTDLTIANQRGLLQYKDIINSMYIIYQLPWDRKYLLNIAQMGLKGTNTSTYTCNIILSAY